MATATAPVTFDVPLPVTDQFTEQGGVLLARLTAGLAPTFPIPDDQQHDWVWDGPKWSQDDLHDGRLEWVIRNLPARPRAVLAHLMVYAGQVTTAYDFVDLFDYAVPKSVPPTAQSICDKCRKVGRRPLYEYDRDARGYVMPVATARLLRRLELLDAHGGLRR